MKNPWSDLTDKKLGVAETRRYDLPLHKSEGTAFLILLVSLMTFLAMMALSSFFVLGAITDRWSSGLENKLTIEIPAEDSQEHLLSPQDVQARTTLIANVLKAAQGIHSYDVLSENEIQALIAPWLGDDFSSDDVPLPGLISVELLPEGAATLSTLEARLKRIVPNIHLDRHENWLNDLLRLTGSLQFSAFLILVIIGFTTITAVAGAIKSRIAVHKKDVELLHLMGAHDSYITRQFQRHAMFLSLQGGILGVVFSIVILLIIQWLGSDTAASLLPDFSFDWLHMAAFAALPFFICAIGAFTARFTVLRALAQMP